MSTCSLKKLTSMTSKWTCTHTSTHSDNTYTRANAHDNVPHDLLRLPSPQRAGDGFPRGEKLRKQQDKQKSGGQCKDERAELTFTNVCISITSFWGMKSWWEKGCVVQLPSLSLSFIRSFIHSFTHSLSQKKSPFGRGTRTFYTWEYKIIIWTKRQKWPLMFHTSW